MYQKIIEQNSNGTLAVTIPAKIGEAFGWKKGNQIWIDWNRIREETDEIRTSTTFKTSQSSNERQGEDQHGSTNKEIPQRKRNSERVGEQDGTQWKEGNVQYLRHPTKLQGQGRQMAEHEHSAQERSPSSSRDATPSVQRDEEPRSGTVRDEKTSIKTLLRLRRRY